MPARRLLTTEEARDLWGLTRQICRDRFRPHVDAMEAPAELPRDVFALLGRAGLLTVPYPRDVGGGQPFEVYLQADAPPSARLPRDKKARPCP